MQALDPAKYPLPEPYPYKEAAEFFKAPEVTPADQLPVLKWTPPDEDALVAYLVGGCRTVKQWGCGCRTAGL
jgi:flap endonuclease-1